MRLPHTLRAAFGRNKEEIWACVKAQIRLEGVTPSDINRKERQVGTSKPVGTESSVGVGRGAGGRRRPIQRETGECGVRRGSVVRGAAPHTRKSFSGQASGASCKQSQRQWDEHAS